MTQPGNTFQEQVNVQPAPGVIGGRASANPTASLSAPPGGFVAGASGVTVGSFAWVDPYTGQIVNNFGAGNVAGFVANEQQALITTFLSGSSSLVPQGYEVTLMIQGDYWVLNSGTTVAVPGQKAYANFTNGLVSFAASGAPATGGSATGSIAANTYSVTGSIAVNGSDPEQGIMTVTAVGSGTVVVGALNTGTGVQAGTQIVSQISGTPGGIGVYAVNIAQTTASTTISGSYGTFTAASALTGAFAVGDVLSGSGGGGVATGTTITALGTGTGGLGTYIVNLTQTVTSSTISAAANVETKWTAASEAQPGELVRISSWVGQYGSA